MIGSVHERDCTVVVATNGIRRASLVRCLRSIADQEDPPAQVICVSVTDELPPEVRSMSHVLVDNGLGASAAKNQALDRVGTGVVAFLDDDCVAHRSWTSALMRSFASRGPKLAGVTGRVLPTREGLYLVGSEHHYGPRIFTELTSSEPVWTIGGGLNMAFRTQILRQVGGFDPEFGPGARFRAAEEMELFYRILMDGFELDYDPEAIVYHEPLDRFGQVARIRYTYRVGLGAFFSKYRNDHIQRQTFLKFARSELHTARRAVSLGNPAEALLSSLGLLGLVVGSLRASLMRRTRQGALN